MGKKKPARPAKGQPPNPYQVFVSHATADKWIATRICEAIEQQTGATTFRDDRDIDGGDDIPEAIQKNIKKSKELLVVLSPVSKDRQWVLLEVGMAFAWNRRNRQIVILCHVEVDPIPGMLKSKKAYSINEFDQYLGELKKRVNPK